MTIAVTVQARLLASPAVAKEAFLDYTWKRGGGLPIIVQPLSDEGRRIWPVALEEVLTRSSSEDEEDDSITYKVTSNGLLSGELVANSHDAVVRFIPQADGTETLLDWRVKFMAKQRPWLWEAFTKQTVGGAASGLAAYLRPQTTRYTIVAPLRGARSATAALDTWLKFTWEGGGLPLPPPLVLSRGEGGEGTVEILRLPHPLLRERVDVVDRVENFAEYRVVNPGLLTFPVHTHGGRVSFAEASGGASTEDVTMTWQVTVRPIDGLEFVVKEFTQLILRTITRNLQAEFSEGGEPAPLLQDGWEDVADASEQ